MFSAYHQLFWCFFSLNALWKTLSNACVNWLATSFFWTCFEKHFQTPVCAFAKVPFELKSINCCFVILLASLYKNHSKKPKNALIILMPFQSKHTFKCMCVHVFGNVAWSLYWKSSDRCFLMFISKLSRNT